MVERPSLRDRFRSGLEKTRRALSFAIAEETPDWDLLEESLVLADVGIATTQELLERLRSRGGDYRLALRDELLQMLQTASPDPKTIETQPKTESTPRVTLVVGVNGVGKTTTAAKLAHLAIASPDDEGGENEVLLVAADTFRAAAQEQLSEWAGRIGVPIVEGTPGQDPASVVHDGLQGAVTKGVRQVIVDTAGRLHTKRPLMDELGKISRVAARVVPGAPHETLLVMDATVGTNGLAQAKEFARALPLTGVVLTKMDGTAKGGVVLAIARELSLAVRFTGVGESAEDLIEFDAEAFVDAITGS